ncbi:hypothetical protein Tco_0436105 [Tanacetum coccineum]
MAEQQKEKTKLNSGKEKHAYDTNSTKNLHVHLSEHQGSWTFTQLKKLSDEEIKAKYERLVRSIVNFVPMGAEVKEVPVIEEPVKEPTAPKQEEIEQPIKKSGRQKSMARKRKLGQSTAKEDEEYEKEKEELSLFLIIAFDEHKEVDYEILDQRSPIIAWNSEYYGPKSLHDEVEVLEEINMNVVTRLNGSKRYFSVLFRVLSIFDRDDFSALYQLVINKYQDEMPKGFDLILWGDLTTMFHPNEEDDFWKSQEKWNIVSWKLHKSSGVHTLKTDTEMVIHMLVEKKYPLMKKVLLQIYEEPAKEVSIKPALMVKEGSIEDEEVSLVDGVLEGALGALGLEMEALVNAHECDNGMMNEVLEMIRLEERFYGKENGLKMNDLKLV